MNTLKIKLLSILLLSFMACKKDKVTPDPIEEPFDITKYVIVENGLGFTRNDPIINTFDPQGKTAILTIIGGSIPNHTHTYQDGILKIFSEGTLRKEFKIENKAIVSSSAKLANYTGKLVKIPTSANNMFNGNTYAGGWRTEGSTLIFVASLKFTDTHYSEASINLPTPNKEYTLFKNIAAQSYIDGIGSIWLLDDGKLEGTRINVNTLKESVGTFTKQ
ncbi:hypothetical protein OQZ33_23665 [Pedobacter sp. MC2016-05]|uniref:hypothetical protein n=1 Tax=Pedobacter sp. MC2016-05 TaxID=2994474 RepID=UPI002246856E|nr:hypothetical protein [Pedobacter sp. MC2016-05]MCX2477353.1 hypothetical protein [Pedobacter sp. MC2016-05]